MCGRYTLAADESELLEAFEVPVLTFALRPRYNVAPTQSAPVVAEDRRGRRIGLLTWGLVPGWKAEPGPGLINARSESVTEKPSFREALERRRCLVPADGFYEWARVDGTRVPHWFHPPGGALLSFAGLWERWSRQGREPRNTFAILTTASSPDVASVHDRMPVVIRPGDRDAWLDRRTDLDRVVGMLEAGPPGSLAYHRVSSRVNRPAEDDSDLIRRLE